MNTIDVPIEIAAQILAHAQSQVDNEICGLIAAKNQKICRIYPVSNIAIDRAHLYRMDEKQQIDAMRNMRSQGEELFGIYHSHPTSDAEPSLIDLREASYPEAIYFIVSLNTKGVLEMRAFKLRDQKVESAELSVVG